MDYRRYGLTELTDAEDLKCIDIIRALITRDGLSPVGCYVKVLAEKNGVVSGILLDEPDKAYDCEPQDFIHFEPHETGNGGTVWIADLNSYSKKDDSYLKDGMVLKDAIKKFDNDGNTVSDLLDILQILRDTDLYFPFCETPYSNSPACRATDYSFPVNSFGEVCFPAFTSTSEDTGVYSRENGFILLKSRMFTVIDLAKKKQLDGIIINPYSECFTVSAPMFAMIKAFNSRLINDMPRL